MKPSLAQQLKVLAFLAAVGGLVARTHLMDDDRYGFCMFRYLATFQVTYAWIHADGRVEPFLPAPADARRAARAPMLDGERDIVLGIGAPRAWIRGFLENRWHREHPAGARLQAVLTYRIYDGPAQSETFAFPPDGADVP